MCIRKTPFVWRNGRRWSSKMERLLLFDSSTENPPSSPNGYKILSYVYIIDNIIDNDHEENVGSAAHARIVVKSSCTLVVAT